MTIINIFCSFSFLLLGHKGEWQLVECGPGTGQFMNDISRTLDRFKVSSYFIFDSAFSSYNNYYFWFH